MKNRLARLLAALLCCALLATGFGVFAEDDTPTTAAPAPEAAEKADDPEVEAAPAEEAVEEESGDLAALTGADLGDAEAPEVNAWWGVDPEGRDIAEYIWTGSGEGYEDPDVCDHASAEERPYWGKYDFIYDEYTVTPDPDDSAMHVFRGRQLRCWYCPTCGSYGDETNVPGQIAWGDRTSCKGYVKEVEFSEAHRFFHDEDYDGGVCEQCGYQCTHMNTEPYEGYDVAGYTLYSANNNYHIEHYKEFTGTYCNDCDCVVGEKTYDKEYDELHRHVYGGGTRCVYCKYKYVCKHSKAKVRHTEYDAISTRPIDGKYHEITYKNAIQYLYCPTCEKDYEKNIALKKATTARVEHNIYENVQYDAAYNRITTFQCSDCGYLVDCQHLAKESYESEDIYNVRTYEQDGEQLFAPGHKHYRVVHHVEGEYCPDCKLAFVDASKETETYTLEDHRFVDGECDCGTRDLLQLTIYKDGEEVYEIRTIQLWMDPAKNSVQLDCVGTPKQDLLVLKWNSTEKGVVSVSSKGKVTAKKPGSTVVTATCPYSPHQATSQRVNIEVLPAPTGVTALKKATLGVGESVMMDAQLLPEGSASTLKYTTSDKKVATVSKGGKIVAKGEGTATITVKTYNGRTATCKVTVKKAPTKVTLTPPALSAGMSGKMTATLKPSGSHAKLTWSSSNESVATVDQKGNITAHEPGWTTITAATALKDAKGNPIQRNCDVEVKRAPVRLEVNAPDIALLGTGEAFALKVTAYDEFNEEVPATLVFKSDGESIAVVDAAGKITGKSKVAGMTEIIITANGDSSTEKCVTVCVFPAPTKVALKPTKATLGVGETLSLGATLTPTDAVSKLTWKSSDKKVAKVSGSGMVTALKAGTATITVKTYNGRTATCTITVKAAPKKVALSKTSVMLGVGDMLTLKATLPSGTASRALTWESDNEDVVTVSNGKLEAVAEGEATVTVRTYNDRAATCTVKVLPKPTAVTSAKTAYKVKVGKTVALKAAAMSEIDGVPVALDTTLIYNSNKEKVATVDANGTVTGRKAGTCTVTITAYNGKPFEVTITVVK